jgi:nucleotide-binding universal stress UspA family protein
MRDRSGSTTASPATALAGDVAMERIRNIVVATDFSGLAEAAAVRAAHFARLDGGAVHLVHAVAFPLILSPYEVALPTSVWESLRQAALTRLEQTRKSVEANGVETVTAEIVDSPDPVAAIAAAVDARKADLVVMGTHGHRGLKRAFLGSVTEHALRTVDRPILAVKEDLGRAARPIEKILLAVDFSPHAAHAIDVTAVLAARLGASVHAIHAFHVPPDFNPYLSELGAELERKIEADVLERLESACKPLAERKLRVTLHFLRGRPDAVIADAARKMGPQLIIMGTRGNTGLSHVLLGSVAERTLRAAPCSVLCVKAKDGRDDWRSANPAGEDGSA